VDDTALYGGISINQINVKHNFGVVGYWVRTSCQRRGIATQAVKLISEFGFKELKLTRLEIVIAEANQASQGVAERAGAVYEGIARNRLMIREHPINAAVFSLVPPG
jgi:RimJ/RimL family protein N-acetyltransferase